MNIRSGFQASCVVTNPSQLFGHNESGALLDQLLLRLQIGVNIQILGEHRSGKTSILRCCQARIVHDNPNLIPVYVNFREYYYIRGRASALRLLIAHIHAAVVAHNPFDLPTEFRINGITLNMSPSPTEHYQNFTAIKDDYLIDMLFKEYVLHTLPKYGVGILLLLDEYEHMMIETFEGQKGSFFLIRDLSSEPAGNIGDPKPCTYILAGAVPWNRLCGMIGSPELNNISQIYYAEPLAFEPFSKMWKQCFADSSVTAQESISNAGIGVERVYDLTGGWPFYGKAIGDHISTNSLDEDAFYTSLLQHFEVVWSHLTAEERNILSRGAQGLSADNISKDLIYRGLLKASLDGDVGPRGILWTRYISETVLEDNKGTIASNDLISNDQMTPIGGDYEKFVFRKEGDYWDIVFEGKGFRLKDRKGLHYIACLLSYPEREFSALALSAIVEKVQADPKAKFLERMSEDQLAEYNLKTSNLGHADLNTDRKALSQLELKLKELRDDLEIAEQLNNIDHVTQLQQEVLFIEKQIAADMGLLGRMRKATDTTERVRKAVYASYNRSLSAIRENHKELWKHLRNGITTGDFVVYNPDKLPFWSL